MNYKDIFVSRISNINSISSYMITNNVDKIIKKNIEYDYNLNENKESKLKYVEVCGEWINSDENTNNTNILGGIGLFKTEHKINIPINFGKKEYFMYFNCFLLDKNDTIIFDMKDMPIFEMDIGENYFQNYIMNKEFGKGMYIEYHNTPHYYINLNKTNYTNYNSYIILGKKLDNIYKFAALTIPQDKMLYIPPYILHNDCCLVGKYKVMYNMAEDFSTVRFVNKNNIDEMTEINFIKHY
jgi:hypothetical protein